MKYFLLTLLILPSYVSASCQDTIKSNNFMLFIDTNESELEIATAEKAACARGEKILVVPKNYKEYRGIIKNIHQAEKDYTDCVKKNLARPGTCLKETSNMVKAQEELPKFQSSQPKTDKAVEEVLKEIRSKKGKVSNLIISGHDGGGEFGGRKGKIDREDLKQIMKKYKDVNDVSTLMLLGCYTGVQQEINEWKNIFPEARMIAGYDDSAPLSDKPVGHQFITEILTKEKKLLAQADQKKLQDFTRDNLKSLGQLNAAVYLDCEEGQKGEEYYYSSKHRSQSFALYGNSSCKGKEKDFDEILTQMGLYESGKKEPPTDTARGEIRQIYIKARNLEHCGQYFKKRLNLNNIFNLLFYEGVKKNFAAYYKSDLAQADKVIKQLVAKYPNYLKDLWTPTGENLAKHSRKDLLTNIHRIHGILAKSDISEQHKRVLSWLADVTTHHLQHFQNPFSWHEYKSALPDSPDRPKLLSSHVYKSAEKTPQPARTQNFDREGILDRLRNFSR